MRRSAINASTVDLERLGPGEAPRGARATGSGDLAWTVELVVHAVDVAAEGLPSASRTQVTMKARPKPCSRSAAEGTPERARWIGGARICVDATPGSIRSPRCARGEPCSTECEVAMSRKRPPLASAPRSRSVGDKYLCCRLGHDYRARVRHRDATGARAPPFACRAAAPLGEWLRRPRGRYPSHLDRHSIASVAWTCPGRTSPCPARYGRCASHGAPRLDGPSVSAA